MARGSNAGPTNSDWEYFHNRITNDQKARILYEYLYRGAKMAEIGRTVLNDSTGDITVSCVMRCYGFSGQNSGYFSPNKGYQLDYQDFVRFVKQYPNGCQGSWPNHQEIDWFMSHGKMDNAYQQPVRAQKNQVAQPVSNQDQKPPLQDRIIGAIIVAVVAIIVMKILF